MIAVLWLLLLLVTGLLVFVLVKLWPAAKETFFAGRSPITALSFVSEEERRRLKNHVIKMNKEAFRLHCNRMSGEGDFEGAFAIHNSSRSKWHVGSSTRVYAEIKGTLHRIEELHEDYHTTGDFFSFRIVPLEGSGYYYHEDLCQALKATYTTGKKKY